MFATPFIQNLLRHNLIHCEGGEEEVIDILNGYHKTYPEDIDFSVADEFGDECMLSNFLCKIFSVNVVKHWHKIAGCMFDTIDPTGESSLYHAVNNQNKDMVEFLLNIGVSPNAATNEGFTPLTLAVIHHNQEIISLLICAKANLEGDARCIHTPLEAAITMDDADTCKTLLGAGAWIGDGQDLSSPLYRARHCGNEEIVNLFNMTYNARRETLSQTSFISLLSGIFSKRQ